MPERKTVFISCGQFTEDEKSLGREACDLVSALTPFEGYFAQSQTTLEALSENVLTRLYNSVGLIVIMHHRGTITGYEINRASVWVEQEVAIATLMQQVLRRPLHAALFIERGITLEGIRKYIQFNAVEFTKSEEVTAALQKILPTWNEPLYIGDEDKRALAESVEISAKVVTGIYDNLTIEVGSHSKLDVEVKTVVFRSKNNRLCSPVSPQAGTAWMVPATRTIPFQMTTDKDISARLRKIHEDFYTPNLFKADLEIELQCEIMGIRRKVRDECTVQVDIKGHQITGL